MEFEDPRFALSAILRAATPGIIRQLLDEAARSSGATADDVRAYERTMREMIPPILDAVSANDETRLRTFMALADQQFSNVKPVPPVARVGLLEIGIRLGQTEVTNAVKGRQDAQRIEEEYEILVSQLRGAALAFTGPSDRRRNGRSSA